MKAVVVGHGPSLKRAGLGMKIDECEYVIRLKNCSMLLAERRDYGSKTDVMCSSTEVLHHLHKVKAKEYWGYPKKGFYNQAAVWNLHRKTCFAPIHVPLDLCVFWNNFFREMGGTHPNVSTGTAALIIALDRLPVDTIYLAGFDNVIDPSIEGYQCTVPTEFNAGGTKSTGHDWLTEHALLPYLAAHFKKQIKDLAGTWKVDARSNDVSPGSRTNVCENDAGGIVPPLSGEDRSVSRRTA